ncbi:hypothetical protein B5E79_13040, partial [Massilimicrobiota sp. An134]
ASGLNKGRGRRSINRKVIEFEKFILDGRSAHAKDNLHDSFKIKLSVSGKISIRIDTEDRTDLRKCFDIVKKDVFKMFIAIHDQVPPRYTYKQLAYYQ